MAMKRVMIVAAALLVAGCGGKVTKSQSVSAMLEADIPSGNVMLNCRASSSGSCHLLLVTGEKIERLSADAGKTATAGGVTDATQYCLQESAPQNGCRLQPLNQGQQIVRSESKYTETN
jgi:hypothetical protein